jgi:hypothetical protein
VGSYTAQELPDRGLPVRLDAEWRAAAVELTAERGAAAPPGALR